MKKKKLLVLLSTVMISAIALIGFSNSRVNIGAFEKPLEFDCSYFFNNDYDSIYEINYELKNSSDKSGTYKTWGTVTYGWTYSGKTNTYIQSRDKNGKDAAILLYNLNTSLGDYPIGSVVEISGEKSAAKIYNNMPEFDGNVSITKLYDSNPYQVETYVTDSDYWKNGNDVNSQQFVSNYYNGPRKISANNVLLSYNGSSNQATLTFDDDTSFITYFANIANTSAIKTKLNSLNNQKVDITGYAHSFTSNSNSGNMELLLREVDDINLAQVEKTPVSLTIKEYYDNYYQGDAFVKPDVYVIYNDDSEVLANDNHLSFSGFDSDDVGYKIITVDYDDGVHNLSTSFYIYINELVLYSLELDDSFNVSTQYSTGNYGSTYHSGYYFQYYRAYGDDFVRLIPLNPLTNIPAFNSCLYNYDPIKDIKKIEITYKTEGSFDDYAPLISYGENNYQYCYNLEASSSYKKVIIDDFNGQVNYFRVESGSSELIIQNIKIYYTNSTTINGSEFVLSEMGTNQYRTNVSAYEDELIPGVSSRTVPIDVTIKDGKYIVNEYKTYTYYDYDYAYNHPDIAKSLALISPIDIANYFSIFKTYPCNYVGSSNYSSAYYLFGEYTRRYSYYTRTDGYATAIPWAAGSNGKPSYYELDIDLLGNYSSGSRGVGRMVCWLYGLDIENYSGSVVCYYTDDHYATFQEYSNLGYFLPRFNAEKRVTNCIWGEPITI